LTTELFSRNTAWGRSGFDRADFVTQWRVGALFPVINEQKTINADNVVAIRKNNIVPFARKAQKAVA
jgi:hypothetical protein